MPAPIAPTIAPTAYNGVASSASSQVDEAKALERLIEVSSVVLGQAIDLVDNSLISDEQLTAKSKYIPGSTIGALLFVVVSAIEILTQSYNREASQTCP